MTIEHYYYGLAALMYLTTCWMFAAVRWFHTCRAPKERRRYIWPDRKLQCLLYCCATLLLPYVVNPTNPAAWELEKSYFPATYHFYCGVLLLCFFGTVKQWNQWKTASWAAAIMVIGTMLMPVINAWMPISFFSDDGQRIWKKVVLGESIVMAVFAIMAMWQVKRWMDEARDANYSNPDDFPTEYARRVWIFPIVLTPLIWPAYLLDSPRLMAIQNVLLAMSNVWLLITVMPVWRRKAILAVPETFQSQESDEHTDAYHERLIAQTALEIETYIHDQKAYLNPHLKIDDVVSHCQLGRSYVSMTFSRRFTSFAYYVNSLRLAHFDQYVADHPEETKESAALASGFPSYLAYYRAKRKLE
jgi:hypothetical protein